VNYRIIYLRDNPDLDGVMKMITGNLKNKAELEIYDSNWLEKINLDKNFIYQFLVRGKISLEIIDQHSFFFPISVIEVTQSDKFEYIFERSRNCIVEQVPEIIVRNHSICLSSILDKNYYFLRDCMDRNLIIENIMSLMQEGVVIFDLEGNIIHTNSLISNFGVQDAIGHNVFEYLDDESAELARKYINIAFEDNAPRRFEAIIKTDENSHKPVEINARLLRDLSGIPSVFVAIISDISKHKKSEKRQMFLLNVVQSTREAIIALDPDYNIVLWNKGAEELLGYSSGEVMGANVQILAPDESAMEYQKKYLELARNEGFVKGVVVQRKHKDGRVLTIELTLSSLKDQNDNYIGIAEMLRDISSVQKNLNEAQKKNEEMEHLINVVSHDLRSPLHSIDNYLSLIYDSLRDKIESDEALEMFERIHANLSNMEALIRDLTDFSRAGLDNGLDVAVDLNSIIEDIVNNIQWQVGRENFRVKIEKMPTLRINPGRIFQVFENLLNNAYKFKKEDMPAQVLIQSETKDGEVVFTLSDSGIGIAPIHQDRIFNLFYRSKEKMVEGSGAGLAIARKIINNYGGRIWVESVPGEGSSFKFSLPLNMVVL